MGFWKSDFWRSDFWVSFKSLLGSFSGWRLKVQDWSGLIGRLIFYGLVLCVLVGWTQMGFGGGFSAILLALAFLATGNFFGFIFGVPRSLQNTDPANSTKNDAYGENTNLEQISDWLTKIIVGITLVQFDTIKTTFNTMMAGFGPALGENGQALSSAIGLFFLLSGFLYSYMWTRIHMASHLLRGRSVIERLERIEQDNHAQTLVDKFLNDDQKPPDEEIPDLREAVAAASKEARERIFVQARSFRRKQGKDHGYEHESTMLDRVVPIFEGLIEASDEEYLNYLHLGYALKDKRDPDYKRAFEMLDQGIKRRPPPPKMKQLLPEMNRAICRIKNDKEFNELKQSTDANVELIDNDLKAGKGAFGPTWHPLVTQWLHLNPKSTLLEES